MAQTQNGNSKKGFASMDAAKQREIASKGGRASAKGDTSRRGFASMDKNKQREISSQGGRSQGNAQRQQMKREEERKREESLTNVSNQPTDDGTEHVKSEK